MTTPSRRRRALLAAPLLLVALALALAGCGGSGGSGGASSSSEASSAGDSGGSTSLIAPDADQQATSSRGARSGAQSSARSAARSAARPAVQQRAVISTGSVSLRSKDLVAARADVDRIVTAYDGVLADEQTSTDRQGRPERTDLTVRVPSKRFDTVLDQLARIGTLVDSSRRAEDVTTQVIDVDQRVAAQKAGLRRLRELIASSGSLRDLLAVEEQVTDRQATLDSLEQQRAYLADQTSLSTITVSLDRRSTPAVARGGFFGGLSDGWAALVTTVAALLRAGGAVLPFAVVVVVLWLPVRAVVRRVRRRQSTVRPAPAVSS